MAMVFCRGCAKEIHETAPSCPHCGAPQRIGNSTSESIVGVLKAIVWVVFWTIIFWIILSLTVGFVLGMTGVSKDISIIDGVGITLILPFIAFMISLSIAIFKNKKVK